MAPEHDPVSDRDGDRPDVAYARLVERRAAMHAQNKAAQTLAPSLVGLTVAQARQLVDQHPGVSVEFRSRGSRWAPVGVAGRINAIVDDGVITKVV